MIAVPVWALKVGCYYAFITCDTAPGVWPEKTPTVIAYHPPVSTPSSTPTSSAGVSSTTVATSTHSFASSLSPTPVIGSSSTVAPSTTSVTSTFVTFTSSGSIPSDSASESVIVTVPSGTSSVPTQSGSLSVSSSSAVSPSGSSSVSSSASSAVPSSLTSSSVVSSSAISSAPVSTSASVTTPRMSSTATSISASPSATPLNHAAVAADILVIARDAAAAGVASSGLNGYGIPFTTLIVPSAGVALPDLNGTAGGNFGGIVVASEVSYEYGGDVGFQSALTTDQWNQLYAYQLEYGVRMVQYDVYPGPKFGTSAIGGCCDDGVEQLVSFTDISDFPTSGLKTGAGVSTSGLYHYPATISNTTSTKQIASFAPTTNFTTESVAGVINNFDGRQQMTFFIGFDTNWSATSSYLQHAWITWITRGLYAGYRRVNLNTQIDDMFLETEIYSPAGENFRIRAQDMINIASWTDEINAKMPAGSSYFVEIGHNGNGNIENSSDTSTAGSDACGSAIEYDSPPDTELEWMKPLGTGTDLWPAVPTAYDWTNTCTAMDELLAWWTTESNLNKFGHISHTFSHEEQNNATYSDVYKEISFNQAWLKAVGIDKATKFTSNGIIPPAITGLHNGDALRAWWENGITNCVGDNTRPALMNKENAMWPLFTTVAANNFDGMQINPRWATRIYYNCDTPACTVAEWIATSAGAGTFQDLLAIEKSETMRHLFGLYHDGYMFHQANLRNIDVDPITINGVSERYSIMQAWVEVVVQEFVRLAEWPIITLTHQEMSASFLARFNRDKCGYSLKYATSNQKITAVTVSATGNTCTDPIPVTFPVAPTNTQGFPTEQLGADPLTVWVKLTGTPVTFTLSTPISL
ncbi:hypothetical protein N7519_009039 [Penicillium mononematosum]|uniref:uncharacterized protein n=1 Tax=Penicillium mononematosum TaxID=268346 RepID=UPI0025475CF0|nr:uncharacterized protein N7519_009039 [Penicillium mononematosum]KAJ6178578.1 hypothetical protein N7519_009039 [Penicillium mononematosum]